MAMGMVVIMGLRITVYTLLQRRVRTVAPVMSVGSGGSGAPFGPIGVMRSWLRPRPRRRGPQAPATLARRRGSSSSRCFLYFFLPLLATFLEFDQPSPTTVPDPTLAYRQVLDDERFYIGLGYSFFVGDLTILISLAIIIPTAYWVRLKVPRLRPVVEFVTLMPFVIPPVVFVFGLIRTYSGKPFQFAAPRSFGSDALLVAAYVVLSFPYMYRAVDTGLAAIDVRSLTEASQSLGASWSADPLLRSSSRTSGPRSCPARS